MILFSILKYDKCDRIVTMKDPLILTFDLGTQSMRALLIDKAGNTVLSSQVKYERTCIPSDVRGRAEQEPDFYYDRLCEAAMLLKQKDTQNRFNDIIAVTITCIRDTVLILDKDHKPLRNIIVWMDERRAKGDPKPPMLHRLLFASVGMTETIRLLYKNAFCNWIMEEEPELWEKTDKFVMLSSYMNYKLTGELRDGAANQVGHIPFDYRNRRWMKKGLSKCVADIPVEKLVDLVDSPGVVGYINKETSGRTGLAEGLPLISTATDKACEALGLSVMTEDKAAISLGTASTIQFCSPHYFEPSPFLPSYPAAMPGFYNGEYQLYRGYWILTWFIRNFCDAEVREAAERGVSVESILDKTLSSVPAGSGGLVLTPHLSPGNNNPFAKGVIMGLSDFHDKSYLYRAIIEGIDGTFDDEAAAAVAAIELLGNQDGVFVVERIVQVAFVLGAVVFAVRYQFLLAGVINRVDVEAVINWHRDVGVPTLERERVITLFVALDDHACHVVCIINKR